MEKSLKRLVNNKGIIQYKHVIETHEDLMDYAKISFEQHADAFRNIIHKEYKGELDEYKFNGKREQLIMMRAQNQRISVAQSTASLSNEKILNMEKAISNGYTIVVNSGGGYTYWNDKEMSLIPETPENVMQANKDFSNVEVNSILVKSDVLILENEKEVPNNILYRVNKTMGYEDYSIISNIRFATNFKEISDLIENAIIHKGCKKIVAESTLSNKEQLRDLAILLESLPPMEFHLLIHADFMQELEYAIGDERALAITNKHKIILI